MDIDCEEDSVGNPGGVGPVDLSIIVVSYNTRNLTTACLESIYEQTKALDFEIIVVDNGSDDDSAEAIARRFPSVNLIELGYNAGYAAANNLAATYARGDYLLLLNPDTVVLDRAIDRLVSFARKRPEYGVYGGATLFTDGTRNPSAGWNKPSVWSLFCIATGLSKAFPRSRVLNPESLGGASESAARVVDIVSGCLLLVRKQHWNQLGGLDEHFFMYGEDADFCLRAGSLGLRSILCSQATIIHYGGASESKSGRKMVRLLGAKTLLCSTHYSGIRAAACRKMLLLWSLSRFVAFSMAGLLVSVWKEQQDKWIEVWRRRREWSVFDSRFPMRTHG